MKTLVIYAHPWEGSFNSFVKEKTVELLTKQGKEVDLMDLNKDGFDPVMHQEDLKYFSKGEYADTLAKNYVERLKDADELVLVFPIWWYGEPAILKGFYDKVLLKGQTYDQVGYELKGLLKAKKATILTTASIDKNIFAYLGDPIQNISANGILGTVGIKDTTWLHCPTVHLEEARLNYIKEVENYFA